MLCAKTSGAASTDRVDVRRGGRWKSPTSVSMRMSGRSSRRRVTVRATCVGAAVEEVVAVDHRHHDVLEAEPRDGARHVLRLAHVDRAARIAAS